ncbi:MAG: PEP-CTERM sorting domain-containing protein [Deltaproteobacteria bacterium]|nr:PEP-CTERM sorting domain-containing protein [Deltaproteobacteria bacterium]
MKKILICVISMVFLLGVAGGAWAETLQFSETRFDTGLPWEVIGDYNGTNWDNGGWLGGHTDNASLIPIENPAAFLPNGTAAGSIYFGGPVTLESFFLKTLVDTTVTWTWKLSGVEVFSDSGTSSTDFTEIIPGTGLIDTLFLSDGAPRGSNAFAIDDITYTVIPEPTTMLLLGSGLIGLAGVRRRFRKR